MADDGAVLQATSAGIAPDGSTYVVLRWEAVEGVAGYNLYRQVAGAPERPSGPINGSRPITPPSSVDTISFDRFPCASHQAAASSVPRGSESMVANV